MGNEMFAPNQEITRQEMATMLANYVNFAKIKLEIGETPTFADDAQIADWAKDSVSVLAASELIKGVGEGSFAPLKTATRAEVATLLSRFHEQYAK